MDATGAPTDLSTAADGARRGGRWRLFGGVAAAVAVLSWAGPAAAHDLAAAELARLNELVAMALNSGGFGILLLVGSGAMLGALHGLEPGHSKTMMSAFIIAIRGTVRQAALLGAAATVSHTAIVWALVLPVMVWGGAVDVSRDEPYFQIASAAAVLAIAGWTLVRVVRARRAPAVADGATAAIDTGHGLVRLTIEKIDGGSRFIVRGVARSGRVIPFREDATVQVGPDVYALRDRDGAQVAERSVPTPHDFVATLRIAHGDHGHTFTQAFGRGNQAEVFEDAHERAHAEDLARRLDAGGRMTDRQVVLFGLSGGLLPCPAAITVLLLCLHLKRIGLGLLLVGSFSVGLAATMIAAGTIAALGVRHLSPRFSGLASLSRPATYASCALIIGIGIYMLVEGIDALA